MQIMFCHRRGLVAKAIEVATWSDFCHTALVYDGVAIEATFKHGVRGVPAEALAKSYDKVYIVDIPTGNDEGIFLAALSQVGKPYDATALLGILAHRDWQEPDRWFCSELVAWAFSQGGHPLFREQVVHRITPQMLWMLAYPATQNLSVLVNSRELVHTQEGAVNAGL